jgi:hypothetical protein
MGHSIPRSHSHLRQVFRLILFVPGGHKTGHITWLLLLGSAHFLAKEISCNSPQIADRGVIMAAEMRSAAGMPSRREIFLHSSRADSVTAQCRANCNVDTVGSSHCKLFKVIYFTYRVVAGKTGPSSCTE